MALNRIKLLEQWREQNGKPKAWMAKFFDVGDRNYNNWVYRNSLPKEFYEKAEELIGSKSSGIQIQPLNKDEATLLASYRKAPPEIKKGILRFLDA